MIVIYIILSRFYSILFIFIFRCHMTPRYIPNVLGSLLKYITTTGGMGKEATKFFKRLALLISEKRKENYSQVLNHIRTRLRFCLLRSTLMAIRGVRGKRARDGVLDISEISYNLI